MKEVEIVEKYISAGSNPVRSKLVEQEFLSNSALLNINNFYPYKVETNDRMNTLAEQIKLYKNAGFDKYAKLLNGQLVAEFCYLNEIDLFRYGNNRIIKVGRDNKTVEYDYAVAYEGMSKVCFYGDLIHISDYENPVPENILIKLSKEENLDRFYIFNLTSRRKDPFLLCHTYIDSATYIFIIKWE